MQEIASQFYWNYFSIGYLVVGIFTLLTGLFAISIKQRSTATFHFAMFVLLASVLSWAFSFGHVFYGQAAVYHRYFTILGSLASSIHILQVLLHYPERAGRKAKILMIIQYIITFAVIGYFAKATWSENRTFHFSGHLWDYDAEKLSRNIGLLILFYSVMYIVFGIYKIIRTKTRERWVLLGLLIGFMFSTIVGGILNILSREGVLERDTFVTFFTLFCVCAVFSVIVLYINNTTDHTSFMVKITGISLVTLVVVFQMFAFFSLQSVEASFDAVYSREGELFLRGAQTERLKYVYNYQNKGLIERIIGIKQDKAVPADPRLVSAGASSVNFNEHEEEFQNTLILASIAKIDGLPESERQAEFDRILEGSPPAFAGYASFLREYVRFRGNATLSGVETVQYLASNDRFFNYRRIKMVQIPEVGFKAGVNKFLDGAGQAFAPFKQVILQRLDQGGDDQTLRNDVLHFLTPAHAPGYRWYRDSADGRTQFVAYMYVLPNGSVIELGFPYVDYRTFVHNAARNVVWILVIAIVFILVGFRWFFAGALVTPLEALLSGVRKVNQGDFTVTVQPRVEDEIGFLTRSFNGMVESIRDARQKLQEYAAGLEEKVTERTQELQATLTQVQSLKTQQDGDYFLTALLLRPLRANRAKSDAVSIDFFQKQKKNFTFRHWDEEIGGDLCMSNNLRLDGRPFIVFMNADAMGKSMQGAGGALVLGSVFEAILERTQLSTQMQEQFPERWMKNAFIELHKVFEAFECSMMVSLVLGLIDETSGLLYYVNAEHPFSIMYRRGKAAFLDNETLFRKLGSPAIAGNIYIRTFQLEAGDVIIVGSDGRDDILISQEGRDPFMNEDENKILRHVEEADADLDKVYEKLKETGQIMDDLTFIRVGYREGGAEHKVEAINHEEIKGLLLKSRSHTLKGELVPAVELLEKAFTLDDREPEVLKRLTLAYVKLKQFDKAVALAEDYTYLRPGDTEFVYIASYCFKKMRNYSRAADFGERVRLRNPRHVKNLLNLCDVYARLGNLSRAQSLVEHVLEIEPQNPGALRRKAKMQDRAA